MFNAITIIEIVMKNTTDVVVGKLSVPLSSTSYPNRTVAAAFSMRIYAEYIKVPALSIELLTNVKVFE